MPRAISLLFACLAPVLSFATTIEAAFSPGDAEHKVVSVIGESKKTIRVAAYSFTSPKVAKALVEAKKRGVDVQAVLDKSNRTAKYSGATFLSNEGIPVRIATRYAIMHNKFLVVDDSTVETGSFNYTTAAAKSNAENVIIVRGDSALAKTYWKEWQRLWDESEVFGEPK